MPPTKKLFREAALERLSSPEQLDRLLQVTSPRGWIALTAVWALLAIIVIWAFFGEIPTKEFGQGIIVAGGGLKIVDAPGAGLLKELAVDVGDHIEQGEVIAYIDRKDLEDEIAEAKSHQADLVSRHEHRSDLEVQEKELLDRLADATRQRHEQTIAFSESRCKRLENQRILTEEVIEQGAAAAIDLHAIDDKLEEASAESKRARLLIDELEATNSVANFQRERDRRDREREIDEGERLIEMLKARLKRQSRVESGFSGRVVEVLVAPHTMVDVGTPIIRVEPEDNESSELEAILYVSAATGKNIEVGMPVSLNPTTVPQEEFGSLQGIVTFIADVPTTTLAMTARLSDRDLVEQFTSKIGLPLEMHVALNPGDTFSGFEWSTTAGPPRLISAGTLCSGSVTVRRQSPLSLVLPNLRSKLSAE